MNIDAVIDTNIVMSGIAWLGPPNKIVNAWLDEKISAMVTSKIVDEYQRIASVLSNKYAAEFETVLDQLLLKAHYCEPICLPNPISNDSDDDKFIACALNTKSRLIVSGDRDLLSLPKSTSFTVMKAKTFCEKYLQTPEFLGGLVRTFFFEMACSVFMQNACN